MSYKALYRTYRPHDFDSVVGQDHIVATLKNIITSDKIGHAYLFAGPRGTGKTSVAHIFARAVNSVGGISMADQLDIIEIDAASNTSVNEVRVLIENSKYLPTSGKYKVYIIDEVHMLSKQAFNALLKILEEPPAHVIFVLATTEPYKLPITVLSRCQRFNFRRIDDQTIENQLASVLTKEKITFDEEAIKFIARLAQGGMRDALSIADQAAAYGKNKISFLIISQVFGIVSIDNQVKLLNYAFKNQVKNLMELVDDLIANGVDIERMTTSLIQIIKDFIIYKKTDDFKLVSLLDETNLRSLEISVVYAHKVIDVLLDAVSALRYSDSPKQVFELAMLKIINSNEMTNSGADETQPVSAIKELTKEIEFEKETDSPTVKTGLRILDDANEDDDLLNDADKIGSLFATREVGVAPVVNASETQPQNLSSKTVEVEEKIEQTNSKDSSIQSTGEITDIFRVKDDTPQHDPAIESNDINDIMKVFDLSSGETSLFQTNAHNQDELLNLLVIADKAINEVRKEALGKVMELSHNPAYANFALTLSKCKLIAAGAGFILVSAEESSTIAEINNAYKTERYLEFTNAVFSEPLYVFAISKENFLKLKDTYINLKQQDSLPFGESILKPVLGPKKKSDAEEFGEELFGSLFNK